MRRFKLERVADDGFIKSGQARADVMRRQRTGASGDADPYAGKPAWVVPSARLLQLWSTAGGISF